MASAGKKSAPSDSVNILAPKGALEAGTEAENFAGDKTAECYREALDFYPLIVKQYENQQTAADAIDEFWAIYNCKPDANQQYTGNSQCYVPAVRDCINARAKRRLKQLFPTRYRHVDAVGTDPETPFAQLALIEHYIRSTRLKETVRSDLVAADVTGQHNLYIDWTRSYRRITEDVRRNPILESAEGEEIGLVDPTDEEDATENVDLLEEGPEIVDFATEDLAVVPPTVNDIEKADVVSLRLRMSQRKVKQMVDEGVFLIPFGVEFSVWWNQMEQDGGSGGSMQQKPAQKKRSEDAGIRTEGTFKYMLVFEATARLTFTEDGDPVKRLAYIYYADQNTVLGIVKAPQWGGKRPVLSAPVQRVRGSFKGISKIEPVKYLQWNLTDYWNMGQDSAMYSLLPVWAVDPMKNPNWAQIVMGLAAVWPVAPADAQQLTQQQLYKDAITICNAIKHQIWESMGVNEMMMGVMPQGRKNNAMISGVQSEQMTDVMDDAEYYEEAILTPLTERLAEYDRQFRTASLTIVTMGEVGVRAKMTQVEPQQFGLRYRFQWCGTQIVQGQQLQQMRIAGMNVLRGIPPQQLNGRRLDVTPILEQFVEGLYGPDLAPRILVDERNLYTVPADVENEMMHNNLPVQVHEADDDQQHIIAHMSAARMVGDDQGRFRAHVAAHTMAMQTKAQMSGTMRGVQPGLPGAPGPSVGGPAVPGTPGTPRLGGMPTGAKAGPQNPPGLPHPDQIGPGRG